MKRIMISLIVSLLFAQGFLWATTSVSLVQTGSLGELTQTHANVKVGELTFTNDEATNDFTLTFSGSGVLTRVGSNSDPGDTIPYSLTVVDSGSGTLTAPINAPGLPTAYNLGSGDYTVTFDASGGGDAVNRVFDIKLSNTSEDDLYKGQFTVDISVDMSTN